MKVNVDQVFTELDGTPVKDGVDFMKEYARLYQYATGMGLDVAKFPVVEQVVDLKLKNVAVRAVGAPAKEISEEEKIKRLNLSRKIFKGGDVDLTTDECALIKKCIHIMYESPLIYAEAHEMIEGSKE